MPYSMTIYATNDGAVVPQVGDRFVVVAVLESMDYHWGPCIFIRLKPVAAESAGNESAVQAALRQLEE